MCKSNNMVWAKEQLLKLNRQFLSHFYHDVCWLIPTPRMGAKTVIVPQAWSLYAHVYVCASVYVCDAHGALDLDTSVLSYKNSSVALMLLQWHPRKDNVEGKHRAGVAATPGAVGDYPNPGDPGMGMMGRRSRPCWIWLPTTRRRVLCFTTLRGEEDDQTSRAHRSTDDRSGQGHPWGVSMEPQRHAFVWAVTMA